VAGQENSRRVPFDFGVSPDFLVFCFAGLFRKLKYVLGGLRVLARTAAASGIDSPMILRRVCCINNPMNGDRSLSFNSQWPCLEDGSSLTALTLIN